MLRPFFLVCGYFVARISASTSIPFLNFEVGKTLRTTAFTTDSEPADFFVDGKIPIHLTSNIPVLSIISK